MLALRRLTGSRVLIIAVVGLAALLVVAVAVVGVLLSVHHDRAAQRIETRWRPALVELGAVRAAAGDLRAAALTGAAGDGLRADAGAELPRRLAAFDRLVAGVDAEVAAGTAAVDRATARWLENARPGAAVDRVRVFTLPASAAGTAPADGTYAAIDARTRDLTALLERRWAHDAEGAAGHMHGLMLYILALAAALLVAVVVAAAVLQRHYLAPAGALARYLRRAARGDVSAGPPPGGAHGWIGRLAEEAEGVSARLAVSQREARRDQEALVQVGPAVRGLHEILVSREAPGAGVDVAGDVRAAEGLIAGDYLGSVALADGTTAVFLGDVCGHGVDAGLLAVRLKSVVMVALRLGADLDTVVRAVKHALVDQEECFTTLFVAVLDPARSTVSWVNAGHGEPFLRRAGGAVERLSVTGPFAHPVLDTPPGSWQTRTTRLAPGDLLVVSTDGLTEGRGGGGEEFGEERAARVLAGLADPTPSAAVAALYAAAERFAIDWTRDDVSLLAAVLYPPGAPSPGGAERDARGS
ncbi:MULTISPECIES: PP2C family protein-serine/threonine phosphatase [unclassified Streptomyces]|uniref:PP2C family protein-serine/threonine phosphatase n=1 Tax=unclassified Streptomyces TaxID=2593676 RepID=UPI00368FFB6F